MGYQSDIFPGGTEQVVIPAPWEIPGVETVNFGGGKMKSDIKVLLTQIIDFLIEYHEDVWSKKLIYFREHLDSDYDQALSGIRSVFGGAGSFNDLILQSNGKMLRTENNTLSELQGKLYSMIKAEILARTRSAD